MDLRDRRDGVTTFEEALLVQLTRIADAIEALVLLNAPDEQAAVVCEHDWVDLGDARECRTCQTRETQP